MTPGGAESGGTRSIGRYLSIRSALQPSFSPDGKRLAFLTNITGEHQLWVIGSCGGWPEQLTFGPDRVMRALYSPVEERLAFTRDAGGNENSQVYVVAADGSAERRLTFDDGAMHILGGWSPDGARLVLAANRRDRSVYDLYLLDVDSGTERLVWENREHGIMTPWSFSVDGCRVLASLSRGSLNHDVFEVELASGSARLLTPHAGDVRHAAPAYDADGGGVYCLSDRDREFAAVIRIDLQTLQCTSIHEEQAEIDYLRASPTGARLAWATNLGGAHHLACLDVATGTVGEAPDLPAGIISPRDLTPPAFSPDGRCLAFAYSSSRRTSDVWVWELDRGSIDAVTRSSHAGLAASAFAEPVLVRYRSFDGLEIPGWYYRRSAGVGPFPVVVFVHGGPEAQAQPMMSPEVQYLVARGYAVLAPNVRGSAGYGKTYAHLDDVEKRLDAVADLAHAALWLREQDGVDPRRIAVYGGSYGGFMVLAALVRDPHLWAAGVDICGIGNFVTFLERTGAYRRSVREAEYGSLERDRELLERISPIHSVDRIRAPLLVIHGANDPRVPVGEAEQIAAALQEHGSPVELLIYPDEGHGLVRLKNRLDAFPRIAAFLDRALGAGRGSAGDG